MGSEDNWIEYDIIVILHRKISSLAPMMLKHHQIDLDFQMVKELTAENFCQTSFDIFRQELDDAPK